jgi:hypothetical protein
MMAKTAYTYGWTHDEMRGMSYPIFLDYWLAITAIESENQLMNVESACSPKKKKSVREKLINRYRRVKSSLINKTGGKLATVQDVAKAFARTRNG